MKTVYLDNAATTAIRPEVITEMTNVLTSVYGNPSSSHQEGRSAKNLLEQARKTIAKLCGSQANEVLFTSSATEATNWVLQNAVENLGVKRIISTEIEHHATLHTLRFLENKHQIELVLLPLEPSGSYSNLEQILFDEKPTLVSLMHVNNEIGTMHNIANIAQVCKKYKALFHCDAVQSLGKLPLNFKALEIDFLVASAHKFHGPKGVGFLLHKKTTSLKPIFYGGEQERGLRAGTEAVHQVVGMAKALSLSYENAAEVNAQVKMLNDYTIAGIKNLFPDAFFVGENRIDTILNVVLPLAEAQAALLLFQLDMKGISVSRGSACQSGSSKPSHVLAGVLPENLISRPNIRISFSYQNTKEDIDALLAVLAEIKA